MSDKLEETFDMFFNPTLNECDCCGTTENLTHFGPTTWAVNGYDRCADCIQASNERIKREQAERQAANEMLNWFAENPN